ncbi:hypothetical protein QAD02_001289, partial [Eretmocerus hayati]
MKFSLFLCAFGLVALAFPAHSAPQPQMYQIPEEILQMYGTRLPNGFISVPYNIVQQYGTMNRNGGVMSPCPGQQPGGQMVPNLPLPPQANQLPQSNLPGIEE